MSANDPNIDLVTKNDVLQSILPEFIKIVRKILPEELPLNMYVHNVEYTEGACKRLIGTLYMSNFRLVFAPDDETDENNSISSGNKYIGDYDIPLASIYKINVAPVNSRIGFKSFLNENQLQSETRTFTIITRDFRNITFTKCSVTKSNTATIKQPEISVTKMEKYIDALKFHSRFQSREQLYLYTALQQSSTKRFSPKYNRGYILSSMGSSPLLDHDTTDYDLNNDEYIKSYMTFDDWRDELYEANEQQWIVDQKKFDEESTIKSEGPYVRLIYSKDNDGSGDLIWHWTHTSQVENNSNNRRQVQTQKYMLITVPGIGETTSSVEPETPTSLPSNISSSPFRFFKIKKNILKPLRRNTLDTPKLVNTNENKTTTSDLSDLSQMPPDDGLRRVTTDTNLVPTSDYLYEQPFQRYNLSKFPCNLKRLQASYEKLIEICVIAPDDDDDKWLTKLNTCKWLKFVSKALHGAASLAKLLDFTNIELVGSDTDNSCLMSSLVQILLRPKCRTIKGFCELIVREWLIRGHKFLERCGQILFDGNGNPVQESPVFLLFLDCVHQLIVQNPFSFEFTDYLLLEFYRNVCYCYHHTFVFNDVLERLQIIHNYPKNMFVLSSFDFSKYLDPEICRLLKNDASIFNLQTSSSSNEKLKSRIEATVIYPTSSSSSSPQYPNRTVYYLETPKSRISILDIPITNAPGTLNPEQYEYDNIESPQIFPDDLHVDWRTFNLVLWSKCYCRYDQNYIPTLLERQLSSDINCLKQNIENICIQSRRQILLDTFQHVGHANSWYPQTLVTRV
ncbi:unnamed protein product [Rotaria sordida]|uniref:Myotubularin phosphatase domain-containing protein n=1 Tax=Rotaria sordida TaxID=392033 RepID=A0A813ZD39_9BILA|nr:unnamed protein product [Rotaria sordida]CAF0896928.1 unnamed protein product [Rotaria sordida]CAF3798779.1 unnamed protein product [Rotaria sordida]CAF3804761.1 unnamed protein product [Rotaria sordida]